LSDEEFWDSTPAEFGALMNRMVKREEARLGIFGGADKPTPPISRADFWRAQKKV